MTKQPTKAERRLELEQFRQAGLLTAAEYDEELAKIIGRIEFKSAGATRKP